MGSAAVSRANQAPPSELLTIPLSLGPTSKYSLGLIFSDDLQDPQREKIWAIFKENMYTLYKQSSFGWQPKIKQKELFDPLSRFFVVHAQDEVVAYAMFRFEHDLGHNVVYCYELQISKVHQREGLGKKLIHMIELAGEAWGMEKIMLTALKANQNAVHFYTALGFKLDKSSPGYEDESVSAEDADYEILYKSLLDVN